MTMRGPSVRPLSAAIFLLTTSACGRDPVLLGFWDILSMEIDAGEGSIVQGDMGTIEFKEGEAAMILRYRWESGDFAPIAQPRVQVFPSSTGDQADDPLGAYEQKGEVHRLELDGDPYLVLDYTGSEVRFEAKAARPPNQLGEVSEDPAELRVVWELER